MNRVEAMCNRLEAVRQVGIRQGKPRNPDGPEAAALLRDQAEEIELLEDKRDGLTEDLYQAVLVAYRRGAVEWTRLNYPMWFAAIERGQEVAPEPVQALTQKGTT